MKKSVVGIITLFIFIVLAAGGYYYTYCLPVPYTAEEKGPDEADGERYDNVGSSLAIEKEKNIADINDIYNIEAMEKESVSMAFVGDILLGSSVGHIIDQKGPEYIFSDTKEILQSADITVANLESPISLSGVPEKDKQFLFRTAPQNAKIIADAGIDVVSLANNHILDYGPDALKDTFKSLEAVGIKYAGAGSNVDEASKPVYIEANGVKIAIIASSHVLPFESWTAKPDKIGVASAYNPQRTCEEIAKARGEADIVVAYLHWGKERASFPEKYQQNLARMFIDSGADLVIGSHPHILQGLEYYRGRLIAYSLGNFVFTDRSKETMILKVVFDKKYRIKNVRVVPCLIKDFKPTVINDKIYSDSLMDSIQSISYGISVNKDGIVARRRN